MAGFWITEKSKIFFISKGIGRDYEYTIDPKVASNIPTLYTR